MFWPLATEVNCVTIVPRLISTGSLIHKRRECLGGENFILEIYSTF
jgi:hypothetical protein